MLEADYNFIENAFSGIKPVTNKEFDDTINKLTPKPQDNSFWGKVRTFLFGRQYGVESKPKGQDKEIDIGGETQAIKDIQNGIYYIKLIASIYSNTGEIIPAGNYKIKQENGMLVFYQGTKQYGMLNLAPYLDNAKNKYDIAYSRVDIVSEDTIRIIYATLDDTKSAVAKVAQ